jgi:hypothetical protein
MATSTKAKIAYAVKYAPKSDEKIQKVIKLAAQLDNTSSKLTADQKNKVKAALDKLYNGLKEQNEKQAAPPTGKKAALKDFKNKVGPSAYKRATSGTTVKKDIEIPAKKPGKRYPAAGKTSNQYGTFQNNPKKPYWENRANRIDVNQPSKKVYPKLAKGGTTKDGEKKNTKLEMSEIYSALQARDSQRTVKQIKEILTAIVKSGYNDSDLIQPQTAKGNYRSTSSYENFKNKKAEEIQKKMYDHYEGDLKGNQPYQVIYSIIELANSNKNLKILQTLKKVTAKSYAKMAKGGMTEQQERKASLKGNATLKF